MNYLEKKIVFHEDEILTFQDQETGKIYVAVTMICNSLGMSKNQTDTQVKKIQDDETLKLGAKKLGVKIDAQVREQMFIELEFLTGWLFKMNPARFDEKLKGKLLDYQLHCQEILTDEFFGKRTLIQLPAATDQNEGLYLQEKDISFRVNRIEKNKKIIADAQIQIIYDSDFIVHSTNTIRSRTEEEYIKNLNKDYLENGVFPTVLEIDALNADRLEIIKKKLNSK